MLLLLLSWFPLRLEALILLGNQSSYVYSSDSYSLQEDGVRGVPGGPKGRCNRGINVGKCKAQPPINTQH